MSTPQTFECPNCGASLDYRQGDAPTIRCSYCNTSVVVPEQLQARAQSPQVVMTSLDIQLGAIQDQAATVVKGSCAAGIFIMIAVMIIVIGGIAAAVFAFNSMSGEDSPLDGLVGSLGSSSSSDVASVAFTFGSEGIGQGLFDDARHVAADGQGNIYVGEYSESARIQVFDSNGQFLALWTMDTESILVSMTVARDGTLYAVYQSDLWRYDGLTGERLGQVSAGQRFDYVTLTADSKLVAVDTGGFDDDIVRMDLEGNVEMRIAAALDGLADNTSLDVVAVDGLGNIYAMPVFSEGVFKFSPDGRFLNRFGGEGDEPGQFRAPGAIAVDGLGRVYVSDFKGVQVFDSDGRYIDVFDFPGFGYGLAFNNDGQLLVANGGTKVTVFDIDAE